MTFDDRIKSLERKVLILIALVVVLLCWVATIEARAQDIGKSIPTAADAVGWALGDIATMPESDRPFNRYVWIPPWGNERWIAAVNFSVNTAASHSNVIQLGTPVANGWMLRYDLRRLAPSVTQLNKLLETWDGLAVQDAYFHVPQINTNLPTAVLAPHLREVEAVALAGLSLSTGAIYRADYLIVKMLTTLEGGRYYDFLQIPRGDAVPKESSPQATWFASLGVFEGTTEKLRADQRSAIVRSGVTGKPRRIDVFHGLGRGGNLVTITRDIADEDIGPGQNPFLNLLDFDDRAREVIIIRPNGTQAYALFNDQGQFQDVVPDNIATDDTIQTPHTKRLQTGISCIRCHGPTDGYQPFGNDVQKLLSSQVDVFSDLAAGQDQTREQIIDRLAGLYAGQLDIPNGPIGRGRMDYGSAVYRIVGGVFGDAPSVVAATHAQVSQIFASYRYDLVTPARACAELGLLVDETQGVAGLKQVLGPVGPTVIVNPVEGMLRAGIPVNRSQFEPALADMALTAERRRKEKK
jgi:hypothetical protein